MTYNESKYRRDPIGRFASKGGAASSGLELEGAAPLSLADRFSAQDVVDTFYQDVPEDHVWFIDTATLNVDELNDLAERVYADEDAPSPEPPSWLSHVPRSEAGDLPAGMEYVYLTDEPPRSGGLAAPIATKYGAITSYMTARYMDGSRAIHLYTADGDPYGPLSTNLPHDALPPNVFRLDANISDSVVRRLEEDGVIAPRGDIAPKKSGYNTYEAFEWIG